MLRSRHRVMVSTGVALIALTAVVLAAQVGRSDRQGRPKPTDEAVDTIPDPQVSPRSVTLASPMDGKQSRLLPVVAEPSTGLTDGQTVAISGSGFTPGARLGAVLCSAGAAGGGGVAFCELAHYDNFSANSDGVFLDDYVLRRFIVTPNEGQVDCAESTDRCILGVGNISNYDESGGTFVSFAGAPDPPPPALQVSPATGLVDGQVISVRGTGVRAAPDGWLRQCPADDVDSPSCEPLEAQPDGSPVGGQLSVTVPVQRLLGSGTASVDCTIAPGCVLSTTEYAGRVATVPLQFLIPGPGTTTTIAPSTTTSTSSPTTTTPSTSSTETTISKGTTSATR